jgi:MFS family permease
MLTVMRAAQGIGGAMLFSTTSLVIVQYLPEEIRGRAFGMMAVFGSIGVALGAPVGGLLLAHLGWRWIFFVNVPFGLLGLVLSMKVLPPLPAPDQRGLAFDLPGALVSMACLSTLVFALNAGAERGWLSPVIVGSAAASVVCAAAFVLRERRAAQPLVDLGIFRNPALTLALMASLVVIVIFDGFSFVFPFFFDRVKGFPPDKTGLILGIFPVVSGLVSPVAGLLVDRLRPRGVCIGSTAALLAATAIFCTFDASTGYAPIVVSYVLYGAAIAAFFTASSTLTMSHAPAGKEGITSALLSMFQFSGSIFGVCLFETIYSLRFVEHHAAGTSIQIPVAEVAVGYRDAAIFGLALGVVAMALTAFLKNKKGPAPAPAA